MAKKISIDIEAAINRARKRKLEPMRVLAGEAKELAVPELFGGVLSGKERAEKARNLLRRLESGKVRPGRITAKGPQQRFQPDLTRMIERALAHGIPESEALRMAAALQTVTSTPFTKSGMGEAEIAAKLAARGYTAPPSYPQQTIDELKGRATPVGYVPARTEPSKAAPPAPYPGSEAPASAPPEARTPTTAEPTVIDQSDEYRWKDVLTRQEYLERFGTDRDVSAPIPKEAAAGGVRIIYGPNPLNHEGHLRKNGKVCGHWAMYAYLLGDENGDHLGIEFRDGFRCWYPSLGEDAYHACLNAESGSYWCHDNGIKRHGSRAYIAF